MLKRKWFVLLLAAILVFSSGTIVQARDNNSAEATSDVVTPYYKYITLLGSNLTIGSLGKAVSSGYVYYAGNYDSTLTIDLQRYNGGGWSTVKSWSESFTVSGHHGLEKEWYVVSGNRYRVVTTATIKNGSTVLETASSTSSKVVY